MKQKWEKLRETLFKGFDDESICSLNRFKAIVKSSMKDRPGTYRTGKETLPLEGGGKRWG